ncbi:uncharacterized protein LOC118557529 [Fundulus heteroclitus]|uniref:uncharacterized protein LOC118557529 n=1 Tax=Fundulus heteroclitus TaxID=8078 RepID=UPI00165A692D|nr:uncharacterized protein LOC118557529 [Fundulus heteroclitus]
MSGGRSSSVAAAQVHNAGLTLTQEFNEIFAAPTTAELQDLDFTLTDIDLTDKGLIDERYGCPNQPNQNDFHKELAVIQPGSSRTQTSRAERLCPKPFNPSVFHGELAVTQPGSSRAQTPSEARLCPKPVKPSVFRKEPAVIQPGPSRPHTPRKGRLSLAKRRLPAEIAAQNTSTPKRQRTEEHNGSVVVISSPETSEHHDRFPEEAPRLTTSHGLPRNVNQGTTLPAALTPHRDIVAQALFTAGIQPHPDTFGQTDVTIQSVHQNNDAELIAAAAEAETAASEASAHDRSRPASSAQHPVAQVIRRDAGKHKKRRSLRSLCSSVLRVQQNFKQLIIKADATGPIIDAAAWAVTHMPVATGRQAALYRRKTAALLNYCETLMVELVDPTMPVPLTS